jgi:cytidylate kinase
VAVITISRGSYSRGKEVAEKVAEKLGCLCVSREAILTASLMYRIPEIGLVRAIEDAPSILDRFSYEKEKYVAHVQAALVKLAHNDNMIYHGLAGHILLRDTPHVLKVRIIADMDDRVALEMKREGISENEARRILTNDDRERRKWSKYLYGIDPWDINLYDLVLRVKKISVNEAADIICYVVNMEPFYATEKSREAMENLLLACEVRTRLVDLKPDVEVKADGGRVFVRTSISPFEGRDLAQRLSEKAASVPGVVDIHLDIGSYSPDAW